MKKNKSEINQREASRIGKLSELLAEKYADEIGPDIGFVKEAFIDSFSVEFDDSFLDDLTQDFSELAYEYGDDRFRNSQVGSFDEAMRICKENADEVDEVLFRFPDENHFADGFEEGMRSLASKTLESIAETKDLKAGNEFNDGLDGIESLNDFLDRSGIANEFSDRAKDIIAEAASDILRMSGTENGRAAGSLALRHGFQGMTREMKDLIDLAKETPDPSAVRDSVQSAMSDTELALEAQNSKDRKIDAGQNQNPAKTPSRRI